MDHESTSISWKGPNPRLFYMAQMSCFCVQCPPLTGWLSILKPKNPDPSHRHVIVREIPHNKPGTLWDSFMVYLPTFLLILDAKCIYHTLDWLLVCWRSIIFMEFFHGRVWRPRSWAAAQKKSWRHRNCPVFRWFLRKPPETCRVLGGGVFNFRVSGELEGFRLGRLGNLREH